MDDAVRQHAEETEEAALHQCLLSSGATSEARWSTVLRNLKEALDTIYQ